LVLCSPFVYRVFQKPLGYAGDYEMVNMIVRDPLEGNSIYAKVVNLLFLNRAPAVAHRNRIAYLTRQLSNETKRVAREGRIARIYNLGCGPAVEVQNFLMQSDLCEATDLTLVDFNEETLRYTAQRLEDIRIGHGRDTRIHTVKKSVHQILKEAARFNEGPAYDFIYCAGLFDYLSDRICKRLMNIFYDMLLPGGLLVTTNVASSNPCRYGMDFLLEWHLIQRDKAQLEALCPDVAPPGSFCMTSELTGVNVFIEVRKPYVE